MKITMKVFRSHLPLSIKYMVDVVNLIRQCHRLPICFLTSDLTNRETVAATLRERVRIFDGLQLKEKCLKGAVFIYIYELTLEWVLNGIAIFVCGRVKICLTDFTVMWQTHIREGSEQTIN